MAATLTTQLAGKDPLVLCVMTGAVIVAGLLLPRLNFQLRVDYLHASRYQGATRGGELAWLHRPSAAIRGKHILVLDDILDEGITLEQVVRACHEDGAASVMSAVLVEKQRPHQCQAGWSKWWCQIAIFTATGLIIKTIFATQRVFLRLRKRISSGEMVP